MQFREVLQVQYGDWTREVKTKQNEALSSNPSSAKKKKRQDRRKTISFRAY
jgi:hypothetical protein